MFQCLIKNRRRHEAWRNTQQTHKHTQHDERMKKKTIFTRNPKMQLITSVIDLEHDICMEWREVEKYLKYDSISGNLHQFFLPCCCLDSFVVLSMQRRETTTFIQVSVDRVILIVSATSMFEFFSSSRYAENYEIKGLRKIVELRGNVRLLSHSSNQQFEAK